MTTYKSIVFLMKQNGIFPQPRPIIQRLIHRAKNLAKLQGSDRIYWVMDLEGTKVGFSLSYPTNGMEPFHVTVL